MPDPAVMHGALRHLRRTERRRLYHLLGDRELLLRFLDDRDETAFEEVVTRHGPMVRAICRRVLGPTADADDAFQAAFLVLLRRARSIRKADLLAGWLCAVAYRTARQAFRRRSRIGLRERGMDALPEAARSDNPPRDWVPLFDAALQRLPAKYRDPVVLCELQGLSRRDASVRLGLTEGTLSSRLGRARDLLRRKLDRYGFPLAFGSTLAPVVVPEALTASTAAAAVHVSAASVTAVVLCEGVLTAMLASKLKAGALATSAVLVLGVVGVLPLTGPANGDGGPPTKDGPPAKEAAKVPTSTPPATAKPDPKPARLSADYEPFQGEWDVVFAEGNGTGAEAVGVDGRWKFAGMKLTTGGELKEDAPEPFTLDVRAKPAAIDFTLTRFDPSGSGALLRSRYQGIYRFEQNGQLVIAFRRSGDDVIRPTRFATAPNAGVTLLRLCHPQPEPKPSMPFAIDFGFPIANPTPPADSPPPQPKTDPKRDADIGKVVGAWELAEVDGKAADAAADKLDAKGRPEGGERKRQRWEELRRLQLLPASGPMDLSNQPGAASYVAYVDLDATRNPKWFTLHATESSRAAGSDAIATHTVRLCGIYKIDGDKLVICLPQAEGSPLLRPTDFSGDGEGGLYLLTYQRPTKSWKPDSRTPPPPIPQTEVGLKAVLPTIPLDAFVGIPPSNPVTPNPVLMVPTREPAGPVSPPARDPLPMPSFSVPTIPPSGTALPAPADTPPVVPSAGGSIPPVPTSIAAPESVPSPSVVPSQSSTPPAAADTSLPKANVPSQAPAPPQSDLDRLQGAWTMRRLDGKVDDKRSPDTLEFLKDRVLSSDGSHGRVRVDETQSPRRITMVMIKSGEETISGIYKLEGDRLTIAVCGKSPKLVPSGFEPDSDLGIQVLELDRARMPAENSPVGARDKSESPRPSSALPADSAGGIGTTVSPPHDLKKEIEQLREKLERLEKELKDRPQ
jgi:RNA polymerase sigma factor (sigma-70 family)